MEKICPRCKLPKEGIDECEYCGLKSPGKSRYTRHYTAHNLNNEIIKEESSSSTESSTIWSAIILTCAVLGMFYYFGFRELQPEPPTKHEIERSAESDRYWKWSDCMSVCADNFERDEEICDILKNSADNSWSKCADEMLRSNRQCQRQCRNKYPRTSSRKTGQKTIYDSDATDEEFEADLEKRRERANKGLKELDRIWEESTGEKWDP